MENESNNYFLIMKYIQLGVHLTDELGIKSITIDHNDTELPSDSKLLSLVAIAMLKVININKEDIQLQDLLSELGIVKEK